MRQLTIYRAYSKGISVEKEMTKVVTQKCMNKGNTTPGMVLKRENCRKMIKFKKVDFAYVSPEVH